MPDLNSGTPWVSFCMSTYKRPEILKKTLALIGAQTFPDFEVVVSDNDPDRSAEAVVGGMNDRRFRYFPNETNLGMVKSFNKSIERATGEFIVMITDDDPVYPEMLATLHDLWLRYPDNGVYFGGHNTFYAGLVQARMAKARPGINSSLPADWELGAVKTYTPEAFPLAYLKGELGGLLWSTGIVKRSIALEVNGFPDYGTPHLADCSYLVLSAVRGGFVYINTALGHRAIHDDNYSYNAANYESIYKAPEGFYRWTMDRLPAALITPELTAALDNYIGRDLTVFVISIKKMLLALGIKKPEFEQFRERFFRLRWLRRWRMKYYIGVHYPDVFDLYLAVRKTLFPPPINVPGK
ncbi:MAG TPA: glycosyltransferase [Puia sp.]|nr:glycosyltransferase [Puia sp.]